MFHLLPTEEEEEKMGKRVSDKKPLMVLQMPSLHSTTATAVTVVESHTVQSGQHRFYSRTITRSNTRNKIFDE